MKTRFLFFLLSIAIIAKGQQPNAVPNKTGRDTIKDNIAVNIGGKLSRYKSYENCVFAKPVQFVKTVFPVDSQQTFNGALFSLYANFLKARFVYDANFCNAKFKDGVIFDLVNVYGDANFDGAEFTHSTSFKFNHFCHEADFSLSYFYDNAYFSNTRFDGLVFFSGAKFRKNVSFNFSTFKDEVTFLDTGTVFYHAADFSSAVFLKSLTLRHLDLRDSAMLLFTDTRLPDTLDFSHNAHIPNEIDLVAADFDSSSKGKPDVIHTIYLYKSDISKIHFDYIHFKLLFTDPITASTRFKANTLSPDETKSLYEQVLKNFKDHGQETSYEKLDIEYEDYTWNAENIWWKKQVGKLIKWWWNYGYSKEKVFIHSAIFILIFSVLNFFILNLLQDVYNVSKIPKTQKLRFKDYGFGQLLHRFWYSFAYTSTIFFSLSIKTEEIDFKRVVRSVYILFIYTFGLVCLAYMANFVLQK